MTKTNIPIHETSASRRGVRIAVRAGLGAAAAGALVYTGAHIDTDGPKSHPDQAVTFGVRDVQGIIEHDKTVPETVPQDGSPISVEQAANGGQLDSLEAQAAGELIQSQGSGYDANGVPMFMPGDHVNAIVIPQAQLQQIAQREQQASGQQK